MKHKNLEWSEIKKHKKTFDKIKIPKGWRLPKNYEILQLYEELDEETLKIFDKDYLKNFHFFFCKQDKFAKENNFMSRVYLDSGGDLDSSSSGIGGSDDSGRVVFVKEKKELEK